MVTRARRGKSGTTRKELLGKREFDKVDVSCRRLGLPQSTPAHWELISCYFTYFKALARRDDMQGETAEVVRLTPPTFSSPPTESQLDNFV